jgi:ribonuclease HII
MARGICHVAGVDEVGRGCLAGPVIAAAVILDPERPLRGLRDSKLLLPAERERLAEAIAGRALASAVGRADVYEIDTLDILRATFLAMRRALDALPLKPGYVLIDAIRIPGLDLPQEGIVRGDRTVASIAAASIVAKVHRDSLMRNLDGLYPGYGFDSHKGYGTHEHVEALRRLGRSPVHRATFRGVDGQVDPAIATLPFADFSDGPADGPAED